MDSVVVYHNTFVSVKDKTDEKKRGRIIHARSRSVDQTCSPSQSRTNSAVFSDEEHMPENMFAQRAKMTHIPDINRLEQSLQELVSDSPLYVHGADRNIDGWRIGSIDADTTDSDQDYERLTTVMLRNIPCKYSQQDLFEEMRSITDLRFNFLYLNI